MGDYFHVGICTDIFLSKIGSFSSVVLKDLSRCMIFLNFFIKRIGLILDLGLTDERDLEKPYHFEQYPRYSAMLASQMGMMNQRTIEQ